MRQAFVLRAVIPILAAIFSLAGFPYLLHADPAAPHRTADHADNPVTGGPKFAVSGAADLQLNSWFGTEDDGVWEYSNNSWNHFTTENGLGDDTVTAMACDALGRVWAGHLSHGISIFNGKTWKNYDRLAGFAGSHVFCIASCPSDGDIWIATEAGLTRYSMAKDTWSDYTRLDGLPSEQISSMAFDAQGNLYLGLAAEGISVGHAADGYSHWTHSTGPDETPVRANGGGLPTNMINAMLVSRDGTVYAATARGLACSVDGGVSWAYVRGKVWPLIAEGRIEGMPDDFDFGNRGELAGDYITSIAEDPFGVIWLGYWSAGYQTFLPGADKADTEVGGRFVTTIVPTTGGRCLLGQYGKGVIISQVAYDGPTVTAKAPPSALAADAFPTAPPVPDVAALDAMRRRLESLPAAPDGVEVMGDDWETGGAWVGSYGTRRASLLGYQTFTGQSGYPIAVSTGPFRQAYMRYYWDDHPAVPEERLLVNPKKKIHLYCENNDESFMENKHPRPQEGPDLFVRVTLPGGVNKVSLFFQNYDAHTNAQNGQRDYPLSIRKPAPSDDVDDTNYGYGGGGGYPYLNPEQTADAELAPIIARSRVSSFYEGVYKRFLFHGAGTYWIKIGRNHSACTKVSAVFIDRLDAGGGATDKWYGPKFNPPAVTDYSNDDGPRGAAQRLWDAVNKAVDKQGYSALADRARLMAYRAAAAAGVDDDTLTAWRLKLLIWTVPDRDRFDEAAGLSEPSGL